LNKSNIKKWREDVLRLIETKFLDIVNRIPKNTEGEYWISRDIQHVRQLYYPLSAWQGTDTAGVGGGGAISVIPTTGEVWEIEYISVSHNDIAARGLTLFLTIQKSNLPIAQNIYISEVNDWPVPKNVEFPVYPIFHQTAPEHDHRAAIRPLTLDGRETETVNTPNSYLILDMPDLVSTKTLRVNAAYRRLV
jgi:hypothetical protein